MGLQVRVTLDGDGALVTLPFDATPRNADPQARTRMGGRGGA